jgi:hypothetical protein
MGTDIHGVFQRHDAQTGTWHDVPSEYEQNRHYQLFAVLAGVRNGYGFAGVRTGEPTEPIAQPRGYPPDFQVADDTHTLPSMECHTLWRREYNAKHPSPDALYLWMGEHSHSWLTGEEMLAWAEQAPRVVKTGVMHRTEYEKWDHKSEPENYSGGVMGRDVVLVPDNAVVMAKTPHWNYVQVEWEQGLREELAYFFDEVTRLTAEHGRIRFVFGFDS